MTVNVTGSCRWVKGTAAMGMAIAAMASSPALAQSRDVTDDSVSARDVAMSPLQDLNLSKDPIPPVLLAAADNPYANPGLNKCAAIRAEISNLDAVLGEDFDTAEAPERRLTAGKVALSVVTGLIPYRGIIRQVSGAADHEYQFKQAISAGLMRRAYLKGLGEAKRCAYPARPATPEVIAAVQAARQPVAQPAVESSERTAGEPVFVSHEVVQPLR